MLLSRPVFLISLLFFLSLASAQDNSTDTVNISTDPATSLPPSPTSSDPAAATTTDNTNTDTNAAPPPVSSVPATTSAAPVPTPSLTGRHGMCGALVNNIAYVYGGSMDSTSNASSQLTVIDLSQTFLPTTPTFSSDAAEANFPTLIHQTCSLSGQGNLVISFFGGTTSGGPLYEYSPTQGNAWASPQLSGTPSLSNHGAATRLTDGTVFIYGGNSGTDTTPLNNLYMINVNTGSFSALAGGPTALRNHAMVWHPASNEIVVIGGTSDGTTLVSMSTVWMFSTTSLQWTTVQTKGVTPASRMQHTAVVTGNNIVVYGGIDSTNTALGDFAVLDMDGYPTYAPSWFVPLATGTAPPSRYDHAAIMAGSNMVVFYGLTLLLSPATDDPIHVLDTTKWAWQTTYTPTNLQLTFNNYTAPNVTITTSKSVATTIASAFTSAPAATTSANSTAPSEPSNPLPAIIGGSVAGGVAVILFFSLCVWRYRKSQKEIKDQIEFAKELAAKPPASVSSRPSSRPSSFVEQNRMSGTTMVPLVTGGYAWADQPSRQSYHELRPQSMMSATSFITQDQLNQYYSTPPATSSPLNPNPSQPRGRFVPAPITYGDPSQNIYTPIAPFSMNPALEQQQYDLQYRPSSTSPTFSYASASDRPALLTSQYPYPVSRSPSSDIGSHPRSPSDGTIVSEMSHASRPLPPTPMRSPRMGDSNKTFYE